MQLVVGLGNPGARYQATRHNIGFVVLDRLAERHGGVWREQFDGRSCDLRVGAHRVLLLQPQTFMNRSGTSVRNAASFFKIPPEEVIVVHDEVDLPLADVRLKVGGGEAGHNGLRSVSQHLGTQGYARLRCGVGRPAPEFSGEVADYVLQAFAPAEAAAVDTLVSDAVRALELALELGLQPAMNQVNRRSKN